MMGFERAVCPRCQALGTFGKPCNSSECREPLYGPIPMADYRRSEQRPDAFKDPLIGRILGDYLLIRRLGEGGFSRVYLALALPVGMTVALKVLVTGHMEANQLARNLRSLELEALALARIHHPNIIRLLASKVESDPAHLVMEYVHQANSLNDFLLEHRKCGTWPEVELSWNLTRQILYALDAAHACQVVHRDLNPDNVLLQTAEGYGLFVRLVDFGICLLPDQDDPFEQRVIGTQEYLAPEMLVGQPVGPWTDLYALGVVLFLLLFQRSPFPEEFFEDLIRLKKDRTYDPTTRIDTRLLEGIREREALADFFRRLLAVDPTKRYQTAVQVLADGERLFASYR